MKINWGRSKKRTRRKVTRGEIPEEISPEINPFFAYFYQEWHYFETSLRKIKRWGIKQAFQKRDRQHKPTHEQQKGTGEEISYFLSRRNSRAFRNHLLWDAADALYGSRRSRQKLLGRWTFRRVKGRDTMGRMKPKPL